MIKKYKEYIKESLRDLMIGPTEEEFWNSVKDLPPYDILKKSAKSNYIKGIEFALENGADPNNDYAINSLIDYNNVQGLDLLVKKGAHIENLFGMRLGGAVKKELIEMVNYLIDYGIDVNDSDNIALYNAVCNEDYNMVKLLLDRGANPNKRNGDILIQSIIRLNKKIYELLKKYTDKDIINHIEMDVMKSIKTNPEWVKIIK